MAVRPDLNVARPEKHGLPPKVLGRPRRQQVKNLVERLDWALFHASSLDHPPLDLS